MECAECEWNVYQGHAPWCSRAGGCFGHCDPEGWFAPCRLTHQPTDGGTDA